MARPVVKFREITKSIEDDAFQDSLEGGVKDALWTAAELVSLVPVAGNYLGFGVKLVSTLKKFGDSGSTIDLVQNPYFVAAGLKGRNTLTREYIFSRRIKEAISSSLGLIGSAPSLIPQAGSLADINVVEAGQTASSMLTSCVHCAALRSVSSRYRRSETIQRWIKCIESAKAAKNAAKAGGFVASVVPVSEVGASVGLVTAIGKGIAGLSLSRLIARASAEIHWRAYREMKIASLFGSGHGPQGPASAIMFEIFTKRGFTRIFGKYDTGKIIGEPCGWMALHDKLMLL